KARLFGSFQKLSAKPTGGEKSTGLGLAITKKIIEAHGGTLGVETRLGSGTTFSFSIPAA
ncbi:MAG: HAMP domain-containing histidine kinase, partial [Nitrospinae bacterium]|nr:HAMP domain-containing histidine kinase [Nitrospinota bacterium]